MVVHSAAQLVNYIPLQQVLGSTVAAAGLWSVKAWAGGRKCVWERDWAGKMILIVGPPTTTVLALIDQLLRLPSPPHILYLPPFTSPLPEDLLTLLHTLRLSTTNPLAQLHCEPLPPTPRGVRDFVRKWAATPQGTASESGRRIDAIILAKGWEVSSPSRDAQWAPRMGTEGPKPEDDPHWTTHQFHFHLVTSLLPHLLRIQAERNIRIISLVSPGWPTALPSLQGTRMVAASPLQQSGIRGLTTLLLMHHLQLILNTLASAAYGSSKPVAVPSADDEVKAPAPTSEEKKERDKSVQSNIMALNVVMPWCRGDVIRGIWGADETWLRWIMYMMWFPLLVIFTPSPAKSVQSILFALMAPVRYGTLDNPILEPTLPKPTSTDKSSKSASAAKDEIADPRRSGVSGGDTIRDCAIIDLPPVLCDPAVAKAHYEKIEKEVEAGVKQSQTREKAFPQPQPQKKEPESTPDATTSAPAPPPSAATA